MIKYRNKPNIIWFITDDTNHKMLGCYGGKVLSPNIDSIAENGVKFNNFYCASSACTPSRYNYLTGHYSSRCPSVRTGTTGSDPCSVFFNTDLEPKREKSIGHAMQDAGYATGFFGKWHVAGSQEDLAQMPTLEKEEDPADPGVNQRMQEHQRWLCDMVGKNGFDYVASVVNGNHQTVPEKAKNHNIEWITKGALDFIDQYQDSGKPFFLNMATTTIHGPDHAQSLLADPHLTVGGFSDEHIGCQPERRTIYERLRKADGIDFNSTTAGVLWMDDAFGTIMARIRELGLEEDTIIIFSTDHGFSGGKFSVYEAGVRIPFLMQWKGHLPEGVEVDADAQNIDLLPTLLDLIDAPFPADMSVDGASVVPAIRDSEETIHEDIYSEFGYARAVKAGRWKYIAWRLPKSILEELKNGERNEICTHFGRPIPNDRVNPTLVTPLILNMPHYFEPDQLYDLENDPHEQQNLAGDPEYADILADMKRRLQTHLDDIGLPFPLDEVDPFYSSEQFAELEDQAIAVLQKGDEEYWKITAFGGFDEITRSFYGL